MKIESFPFDPRVDGAETHIVFPMGIPGFEKERAFQLFHQHVDDVVGYLQSVENPDLTLSVFAPESLNIFYEFTLSDDEQALLKLERAEDAALLLVAYRQPAQKETDSDALQGSQVNANFMAPLVINVESRLGLQKVLYRTERRITIKAN